MAIQFWRLPRLDWFADHYLRSLTLEEVRNMCTISIPPLPADEIYQLLQDDDGFRKYARAFLLPLTTFELNRPIPVEMEWKILDVDAGSRWANHLCTDAPLSLLIRRDLCISLSLLSFRSRIRDCLLRDVVRAALLRWTQLSARRYRYIPICRHIDM